MPSRVVAVDLGTRRIGVAVTDGLGWTPHPLATIARHGAQRDLDAIAEVVKRYDAGRIVMGLPLGPEGEGGRAARSVHAFVEPLSGAVSVPIDLIDESFTAVEAEDVLLEADLSRA